MKDLLSQFNSRSPTPSSSSSITIEAGRPSTAITRSHVPSHSLNNSSDASTIEASVESMYISKQRTTKNNINRSNKSLANQTRSCTNDQSLLDTETSPELLIHNFADSRSTCNIKSPPTHRSTSPVVPALPMHLRPESRILPPNFQVPPEAFTDVRLHKGFCKFSALIKGHLTRRLMKTDRIQRIIAAMRDTMTIALQLHREAKQSILSQESSQGYTGISTPKKVSSQDVELHRRLLQQLFKDSQEFHNMFFKVNSKDIIK